MKYIVISLLLLLVLCGQKNAVKVESKKFVETFTQDRCTLFGYSTDL